MAPHCDTMDGPVVTAAEMALEMENINYILPFIAKESEDELKYAFEKTLIVRGLSEDAADIADYWFFETAVRLHRKNEGKPYYGLKPAGLDWGPVVSLAENALESEDSNEIIQFLSDMVEDKIYSKFSNALEKKDYDLNDVEAARKYTNSMLDFVLYSNDLYKFLKKDEEET
ncbi:MAG: DUF6448 family protein [Methanomicrobiales archaeon]